MTHITDEYRFETFVDPPGENDGIIAVVCDTAEAAKALQAELPDGHKAYGVLEAVGGARFKDIEFQFDFALPRYRYKRYRKDFLAVLRDSWLLHAGSDDADRVENEIRCIEVALQSM